MPDRAHRTQNNRHPNKYTINSNLGMTAAWTTAGQQAWWEPRLEGAGGLSACLEGNGYSPWAIGPPAFIYFHSLQSL